MFIYHPDLRTAQINEISDRLWPMRPQVGDSYTATNLQGATALAEITAVEKKKKQIQIRFTNHQPVTLNNRKTIVFQAMPDKTYLSKWAEIIPLLSVKKAYLFRSEYSPKYSIPKERLDQIIIRACELSESSWKPEIIFLESIEQLEELILKHKPFVLDSTGFSSSKHMFSEDQAVLIGPEGGWGRADTDLFTKYNLERIRLAGAVLPSWFTVSQVWK